MIGIPDSTFGENLVLLSQNEQLVCYAVPLLAVHQPVSWLAGGGAV